MSKSKLAGIIVACVIAVIVVVFVLSARVPTEPVTPGTRPPTEELGGIKITASDLFDEYNENEIAADHEYKNHILTIVGKIVAISRDAKTNKPYVSVCTARPYSLREVVRCFFNHEGDLLNLVVGEEIIAKGKCLGKNEEQEGTSFPIILENCSLIEQTEFEVVNWKMWRRPTSWCGLEISFRKFGYSLDYFLINPEGVEKQGVAGIYEQPFYECSCADTEGTVYFALFGTPPGGRYDLLVKDSKGKVVAIKAFDFSGASPKVEVTDYSFGSSNVEFSILYSISFRMKNNGDLPINVAYLEVGNSQGSRFYFLTTGVQLFPGEEGTFEAQAPAGNCGLQCSRSGEQRITLSFRDSGKEGMFSCGSTRYQYGRVVYSIDTNIIVP